MLGRGLGVQAEHLASRPGYLALAVDGATPRSRFGRLHRRRHSGTIAGKGCWLVNPICSSLGLEPRARTFIVPSLTTPLYRQCEYRLVVKRPSILACIIAVRKRTGVRVPQTCRSGKR
jgi:hypothetical protein